MLTQFSSHSKSQKGKFECGNYFPKSHIPSCHIIYTYHMYIYPPNRTSLHVFNCSVSELSISTYSSCCSWFPFLNFIFHIAGNCQYSSRAVTVEPKWWRTDEQAAGIDVDLLALMVLLFSECKDVSSRCIWMSSYAMLLYRVLSFSLASPGHPLHSHTHTQMKVSGWRPPVWLR